MRRLALLFVVFFSVSFPAASQGLQVAQLYCQADGLPIAGRVDVSLLQHGQTTGSSLMPWEQRRNMQAMVLSGDVKRIPGLLNYIGMLQHGQNVIGFEVTLTQGTWGTGQYYLNGQAHRGTIMELHMQPSGFLVVDEYQQRFQYKCQPMPGTEWAGSGQE